MTPTLLPLGDRAMLVRFGTALSDAANRAALAFATLVEAATPVGVTEIVPSLVSVLLRYDPGVIGFDALGGEVRLLLVKPEAERVPEGQAHRIDIIFDGEDLDEVAALTGMSADAFVAAHNSAPLRVMAVGFAPGFIYAGLHMEQLVVPRRKEVRRSVPAGSVLFAAGQTAIASTALPTGWHVIGHTSFRNFDPQAMPPTQVVAGDQLRFEAVP
ncbi:5-oxoprolinase subunit B family protein [Devosia sp.]|uniref:5-oxoprolinase subunit B family protein n=1 Tax=Devosia sp. TaxID=1871048 RepID=UPI003A8F9EC7